MTFENIVMILLAELASISIILGIVIVILRNRLNEYIKLSCNISKLLCEVNDSNVSANNSMLNLTNIQSELILKLVDIQEWHNKILSDEQVRIHIAYAKLKESLHEKGVVVDSNTNR